MGFHYVGRVERDITGGVHLHIMRDDDVAELSEDAAKNEFVTLTTTVDLFKGPKP